VANSSEHKMLFDVRGRRRRVIQVVYATLAILMGASLFLAVGPVSLTDVIGTGGSGDAGSAFDDQIERVEKQLAKDPQNEELLLRDFRLRTQAANAEVETDPATGAQTISEEGFEDFRRAGDLWIRYIKLDPKQPRAGDAQFAAQALFASSTLADLDSRVKSAAEAQAIVAEARPSASAYLTLAQYYFLAGDGKAGEQAIAKAKQEVPAQQRQIVEQTAQSSQQQAEQLRRQFEQAQKAQAGAGKEALENPLGGLGGGGSGTAP
jgi:hypothetical protein